jgi:glycosyltransferase involved in cell wall biosynthesis
MRIGMVVPGGVDASGRIRVIPVLLSLIERIARRHHLVVVNLDPSAEHSEYDFLGAHIISVGPVDPGIPLLRQAILLKRLISILRSAGGQFDLLHALWVHPPGTLAVAAGALLRVPVIVSIGGGELVSFPEIGYGGQTTWRGRALISTVLGRASAISAGSHYALRPLAGIHREGNWVPLGVEARSFQGPIERLSGPPWRLLHVAGLNEVKDQDTLLRALQLVLMAGLDVHLDCFGVDTLEGRIQSLAANLGIPQAVRFHGFRPVDEFISFYHRAHLYVQSSLHESMGAAVLEAAAGGVPIIGTAVGLVAEMSAIEPKAALAVPVSDPQALARGIIDLLNDPPRREAMARSAQGFALSHDADWTLCAFEKIYEAVGRR